MIFICLKYFCIDLSGLSRLGCPCLRLTDDDDDSRPAQMIPIALMIPAGHPPVPPPTLVSISLTFLFSISGCCCWTKTTWASRPGISALIISPAFRSFSSSLSLWSVNLTPLFAEQKSVASGRREGGEANHTIRPGSSYDGIRIVVLRTFLLLSSTFLPTGLNWYHYKCIRLTVGLWEWEVPEETIVKVDVCV